MGKWKDSRDLGLTHLRRGRMRAGSLGGWAAASPGQRLSCSLLCSPGRASSQALVEVLEGRIAAGWKWCIWT